jgi:hypothetical protein
MSEDPTEMVRLQIGLKRLRLILAEQSYILEHVENLHAETEIGGYPCCAECFQAWPCRTQALLFDPNERGAW